MPPVRIHERTAIALVVSLGLLVVHWFLVTPFSGKCSYPYQSVTSLWLISMAGMLIFFIGGLYRICETVLIVPFAIFFVAAHVFLLGALLGVILGLFSNSDCLPWLLYIWDIGITIAGFKYALPLMWTCLKIYLWIVLVINKVETTWERVEGVFGRFVDPFIGRELFNKALNNVGLSEKEIQLLEADSKPAGIFKQEGRIDIPPTCSLCTMHIANEARVTIHPQCEHAFHTPCLGIFLRRRGANCPICGQGTRQGLYLQLKRNTRRGMERALLGEELV